MRKRLGLEEVEETTPLASATELVGSGMNAYRASLSGVLAKHRHRQGEAGCCTEMSIKLSACICSLVPAYTVNTTPAVHRRLCRCFVRELFKDL